MTTTDIRMPEAPPLAYFDPGDGRRIAYRPARGTRSLFGVAGQWCGTVDQGRGGMVLAVTPECARAFMGN